MMAVVRAMRLLRCSGVRVFIHVSANKPRLRAVRMCENAGRFCAMRLWIFERKKSVVKAMAKVRSCMISMGRAFLMV